MSAGLVDVDTFMKNIASKVGVAGECGGAAASLVVANQKELQLASTMGCSKTIIVKNVKQSYEGIAFFRLHLREVLCLSLTCP